jgi:Ca-activated chloride channel family protein
VWSVFVRKPVVAALLIAMAGGVVGAGSAQEPVATFKSSIEVVPISAVVRDRRGHLVTSLSEVDFEVLDNGERRRIVDFQIDRTGPVTLAVLLDTSGSMVMGPKLAFATRVVEALAAGLSNERDELALFTFDSALHERTPFGSGPNMILSSLDETEPFGATSLYDAIAGTARRLADRPSLRRAIVVLTDGVDTGSALTPGEVSALAGSVDVPVYVVVTVPSIDEVQYLEHGAVSARQRAADLRDLANWTGGDLLLVSAPEHAPARSRQVLTELRQRYLLAIESAQEADWRPLDVRVRDRRLTVRARRGYYRGSDIPSK